MPPPPAAVTAPPPSSFTRFASRPSLLFRSCDFGLEVAASEGSSGEATPPPL